MTARFRSILLASATLAIGATSLHAQPARSAKPTRTPWAGCDSGEFCIYEHSNGTGYYASFDRGTDNLNDPKVFGRKLNDKTSAVWNRDVDPWCIYENATTNPDPGHIVMIRPGFKGSISRLVARDDRRFHWNDKVSRVRKARYVAPPLVPAAAHFEC